MTARVRVVLPAHLQTIARVSGEVTVTVTAAISVGSVLDALEQDYPMLRGTIRDHGTLRRRPFVRFFVCGEDRSLDPTHAILPEAIARGDEPLLVVGAMAGG